MSVKSCSPRGPASLNRREFLGATMLGTTMLGTAALVTGVALRSAPLLGGEIGADLPTFRFRVQRHWDLLSLEFSFVNFEKRRRELCALGLGRSLVVVRFPPQNLAEAIFNEPGPGDFEINPLDFPKPNDPTNDSYSPIPPVRAYLSGPSWLVFAVPDGMRIPLEADFEASERRSRERGSIVDCWARMMSDWKIRVPANAETPGPPSMPSFDESCLEIPFRVFIAPSSRDTRWLTSSERLWGLDNRPEATHELWHASLLSRKPVVPATSPPGISNLPDDLKPPTRVVVQARAVFSPDYQEMGEPSKQSFYPSKLQLSLHSKTRHLLVKQMSEGDGWIDAEHLVLSALGCDTSMSYTSQKTFDQILQSQTSGDTAGSATELSLYRHRIVMGRDQFIVEPYAGFLFPFVYPAIAIELTRRKFSSHFAAAAAAGENKRPYSSPGAYLLKEYFILVQDPLKQCVGSGSSLGRSIPPKKMQLKEIRSPLLADWNGSFPIQDDCVDGQLPNLPTGWDDACVKDSLFFIPRRLEDQSNLGADGVRWAVHFEDEGAQPSDTSDVCLMFAQNVVVGQLIYNELKEQFRTCKMAAQPMAFAPEKAELSVLADRQMPHQATGTLRAAGQTLGLHELEPTERQAARVLADGLRIVRGTKETLDGWIKSGKQDVQQFAKVVTESVSTFGAAQQQALGQFRKATLQALDTGGAIAEAFTSLASPGGPRNSVDDAYQELLRQLDRAQQATSTLETHKLVFKCQPVYKLFSQASTQLNDLSQKAKKIGDFTTGLANLQLEPYWQGRIGDEVNARLDGLGDWQIQQRELQAYVDELSKASKDALTVANQYFHPLISAAQFALPALKAFGNQSPLSMIDHLPDYLAKGLGSLGQGFSRVQNGAFATLANAIDQGAAMADKIHSAVARPAAIIAGISRDLGALSGSGKDAIQKLANQLSGDLAKQPTLEDLKNAIPDAKLFGVLPLKEIITGLLHSAGTLLRGQLSTISQVTLPDHFEQTFSWESPVTSKNFEFIKFDTRNNDPYQTAIYISSVTRIETPKTPAQVTQPRGSVTLNGTLGHWDPIAKKPVPAKAHPTDSDISFDLGIAGLIKADFISVEFTSVTNFGQSPKTSLTPKFQSVEFEGPLLFVKDIEDLLAGLLGDGLTLDVQPSYVQVGLSLPFPPMTFGYFTLNNLSIGTSLRLPFDSQPLQFNFNLSSQKQPCELAVLCFGGTAYLQVALLSDGTKQLDGALDFGGILAFDVEVASGELHVLAGFQFHITHTQTDLSGYLRAGGSLNVLDLIHATVEFVLMGRYTEETNSSGDTDHLIYGIATLTVSIDLFMFSVSVSVTLEKRFAGSSTKGPQQQSSMLGHSPFRLAAFTPADPQRDKVRVYFDRQTPKVFMPGRFSYFDTDPRDSIAAWDAEYWSQFAF